MSGVGRYVWVSDDPTNMVLNESGPFLWDPDTTITYPDGWQPMEESAALAAGYTYYVAPPDPTSIMTQILSDGVSGNASYLGVESPSATQIAAQVHDLTRIVSSLAKLYLGQTGDLSGT